MTDARTTLPPEEWAGYREHRVNDHTGGYNVLVRADEAGLDPGDGEPWLTICDVHSTVCCHETYNLARKHLKAAEWCEPCQETDSLNS